jgi:TolA-binding protein
MSTEQSGGQTRAVGAWALVICWSLVLGHWDLKSAHADELWVSSGGSGTINIKGAKITRVEGGHIFFTASGKETSRELAKVQRILVDGEAALSGAEEAYATANWSAAVDGYQRTIRSTTKPWLKDWATVRLIDAANKSGRFDAAATAYVAVLMKDPASAASLRPAMPAERSTYLDTAANEVTTALGTKGINDQQRQALLTFLMDLHRARKDKAAEEKAAAQLDEILAKDPNNPAAGQAIARRKLLSASKAIEAKDYRKALAEIDEARDKFTDPAQQADALFYTAVAKQGLADGTNGDALKDVALAYMRVVAHFKNEPGAPHVAESLVRVAQIHEQLGEPQTAANLYEQVASQFKDDPSAQVARQSLQRLGQQTSGR